MMLYNAGGKCTAVTGGWSYTGNNSPVFNANNIVVEPTVSNGTCVLTTTNKIDLTGIKTFHFYLKCDTTGSLPNRGNCQAVGANTSNAIRVDNNRMTADVKVPTTADYKDYAVDVSALSGSYYILVATLSVERVWYAKLTVSKIWGVCMMTGLKGIDISVWQSGFTNFEPFKNAGYGYVICKISEGQSTDKCFEQHYGNCTKSNISVGVYVFSHATDTSKARAEAEYALKILNGRKLGLPIFMDLEASDINYGWNVDITPVALAFGEIIKKAGYKWGVYANQSWLINKLKVDTLRDAGAMIWCAKYSDEKPTVYCDIWQYSDNGTVPGFPHKVDMNITMTDVLNGAPAEIPQEEIKMTKKEAIAKLVNYAKNEVGYLEKRSNAQLDDKTANAGSNNWNKYARDIDTKYPNFYNGKKNGYSWCDIFVDWCFIECFGYEKALKMLYQPTKSAGAGCQYSANYYRAHNAFYRVPNVGDQVFFGDYGNEGHTGIVIGVEGSIVTTVEGNTSGGYGVDANGDGVYIKRYDIRTQYIPGFGRPNWGVVANDVGSEEVTGTVSYPTIKLGSKGSEVKKAQQLLIAKGYSCGAAGADGDFGAATYNAVKKFQAANGLEADGIVGAKTWAALLKSEQPKPETKPEQTEPEKEPEKKPEKPVTPTGSTCTVELPIIKQGDKGFTVVAVQTLLGKHNFSVNYIDGEFGPDTFAKIKAFQRAKGLTADGVVGSKTWIKLLTNK